jgi:hypothetical protein
MAQIWRVPRCTISILGCRPVLKVFELIITASDPHLPSRRTHRQSIPPRDGTWGRYGFRTMRRSVPGSVSPSGFAMSYYKELTGVRLIYVSKYSFLKVTMYVSNARVSQDTRIVYPLVIRTAGDTCVSAAHPPASVDAGE